MKDLYSDSEPYAVYRIAVTQPHELYVEECGNPTGVPVIFLHGGPGSGCAAEHRRFFDPAFYRIILFDQRGSGRSTPLGETDNNRTADLVSDMEIIRRTLGVERWLLFGGSWGASLALIYAQTHPHRLLGMVLRGIFLARERDLKWFYSDLQRLFPQQWETFSQDMESADWDALIAAYHQRIHCDNRALAARYARAWFYWGSWVVHWNQPQHSASSDGEPDQTRMLAKSRIETHYARNRYFIRDNQILAQADSLPAVPVSIVQGRRDLTCPMECAWLLHRAVPGSRLIELPQAGHLISEPAMASALIEETERMKGLL